MLPVLAEVDPVPRPDHDAGFPDAAAYALVVAEIPSGEADFAGVIHCHMAIF
jgi:hypothetical protein